MPPLRTDPNRSGQATAFMAMCPVRPEQADQLTARLRALDPSPFAALPRTHMARLVVISDFAHDPAWGLEREELDVPYLVFTSNFDGPTASYLDQLCALPNLGVVWGCCIGAPAACRGPALKEYLLHNQIHTGLYFAAYGHATVQQVQQVLERFPAGEEWPSDVPTVRMHIARAARLAVEQYQQQYEPGSVAKRDQHANEYGTIIGSLRVTANQVPEDMRHGLFAQDGAYPVTARVSPNRAVPKLPFFRPPIGIALKVHDVDGPNGPIEQDFILGGPNRFFAKTAEDGVDLVIAQARGARGLARYVYPSLNPRRWRLQEVRILFRTLTQLDANPLWEDYNTQITVSCGPLLVKAGLVPQTPDRRVWCRRLDRDPAGAMARTLHNGPVVFDFMLQRQAPNDPDDDPRQAWTGPWEKVAEVQFDQQEVGEGERLVFTLANTLPEHRAAGELAELRIALYAAISELRTRLNAEKPDASESP